MEIKELKTEDDYRQAVQYLEEIGDNPNFENDPKLIAKSELLETLIESYENEHYHIEKGNPVEIIKMRMENMGLEQKDHISEQI